MVWFDYSAGRPPGAAIRAAGGEGVIRYIGLGSESKQITGPEYQDLIANGVKVLLVVELDINDAWGGPYDDDRARGRANATIGLNAARARGIPDSVGMAAAADAHAANAQQISDAVAYAQGFADVLGHDRTGFYGFFETLNAVHGAGVASWYWRCGAEPQGPDRSWVNFWQRNNGQTFTFIQGVQCDINDMLNPPTGVPDVNLSDRIPVTNGTTHLNDTTVGDALGRILFELVFPIESRATINRDPKNTDTLLGRATSADGNAWDNAQRLNILAGSLNALAGTVDTIKAAQHAPAPVALTPTDVDTIAVAVLAKLGPALADQVADKLAARLVS